MVALKGVHEDLVYQVHAHVEVFILATTVIFSPSRALGELIENISLSNKTRYVYGTYICYLYDDRGQTSKKPQPLYEFP